MENCCRTCLKANQNNQMKLLSTKWNDTSLSFADILMDIVNINKDIKADENQLNICSSCETDLITAHNFKIVCQNTEKILSERLTQTILFPTIITDNIKYEQLLDENSTNTNESNNEALENRECSINDCPEKSSKQFAKKRKIKLSNEINKSIAKTAGVKKKVVVKRKTDNSKIEKSSTTNNESTIIINEIAKRRKRNPCLHCKKCDLRFEAEKFYRRHCEETHWQAYACNICGKLFLQNRIKKHILTHTTERNHICSVCGAKFTTDTNLKDHLRIHSGEKRYKCTFCDEKFVHSNSRKNHIYKVHTKEKKYECYICHRLFAQRGQMILHIKYHLGDLNFPCSLCDKRFPHAYALKVHELTHLNIRKKRVSTKKKCVESIEKNSKTKDS